MALLQILPLHGYPVVLAFFSFIAVLIWIIFASSKQLDEREPESIPDFVIPGFVNTYKFIFHNQEFLEDVRRIANGRSIMKFWLGPKRVYIVTGAKNNQAVLRNSGTMKGEDLILMAMAGINGMPSQDLAVWKADKSGRGHVSLDATPEPDRIWAASHRIFTNHMSSKPATASMVSKFCEELTPKLERRPVGEWETIQLYEFLKYEVVEASLIALAGPALLRLNPGFINAMWDFDQHLFILVCGVPRMFYRKGHESRDRYHEMGEKWLNWAFENYNWNGPDEDWDEVWGTRYARTYAKEMMDRGFGVRSRSGSSLSGVWASNANSIPIAMWAMIEIIQDADLYKRLRVECLGGFDIDSLSGKRVLNLKKLLDLPLLASIYAECLRLHVYMNIIRGVHGDMELDGYILKKGSLAQSPSMIAHLDEEFWARPGHPASDFWAERFIVNERVKDVNGNVRTVKRFSTDGMAGHWFPYGGGITICAGRAYAKQEILIIIAMLVVNFDIELLEYVYPDGTKSERGPENDQWWCGTAAMPPDRDLKVRWKRI